MTELGEPIFVCPRCRGELRHERETGERYRCARCGREYPVVLGIPDFRLEPDPWISPADDRAKAQRVAAEFDTLDFESLVRFYWSITPDTPPALASRFTAFAMAAERRSREWLTRAENGDAGNAGAGYWLEIGCGTGDLLVAARARGLPVIGVDVAFRWLVVARRRLAEAGVTAPVICANAEHLPFADATFARVVSLGTIEHCRDAAALVRESRRVLRRGGVLQLRTVNRFAPVREPHVGVWGVGLLPRRWADAYVHWRSGQHYLHHRPLSIRELRRGLRHAGFTDVRVSAAQLLHAERDRLGALRWAVDAYNLARRVPGIGAALGWVAPLLEARGSVA